MRLASSTNYTAVPWSEYFNPDAEYGLSRLDSPQELVASPIIRLPFGAGERWLTSGVGNWLEGRWTVSLVIQVQSGFPLGVSQNTNNTNLLGAGQRPNGVPGVDILVPGDITDRLRANPDDNLYLNPAAWSQSVSSAMHPGRSTASIRRFAARLTLPSTRICGFEAISG